MKSTANRAGHAAWVATAASVIVSTIPESFRVTHADIDWVGLEHLLVGIIAWAATAVSAHYMNTRNSRFDTVTNEDGVTYAVQPRVGRRERP